MIQVTRIIYKYFSKVMNPVSRLMNQTYFERYEFDVNVVSANESECVVKFQYC